MLNPKPTLSHLNNSISLLLRWRVQTLPVDEPLATLDNEKEKNTLDMKG